MAVHATAIVEEGVELGEGCTVAAYAVLKRGTVFEKRVQVFEHAVIGGAPQDFKFDMATASGVRVGAGSMIREGATIHRSVLAGGFTKVGTSVFMMCNSHVAHDCVVGDHAILANGVLLGGDVTVGAYTFLGGNAAVHQYVRIGEGCMVAGMARVAHDVPPFCMTEGYSRAVGLNLVGLRRRGFDAEVIADLKRCYRAVLFQTGNAEKLAAAHNAETVQGRLFLDFFKDSKRGYIKRARRD